ncbi:MAG: cyclic nucleotide-binding domain-containing protein [Lachnospiraceae bacterium]|nr:cyclic nucleotide-binding domain-containing protein [Lachnospiraceae bacterium]
MKEIKNLKKTEYWINVNHIRDLFDTKELDFRAYEFEKGELLAGPGMINERVMFIVEGSVYVYGIRNDGSITPVNKLEPPAMIGDMEFTKNGVSLFFAEAKSNVICISLSLNKYRKQLEKDNRFLHVLLQSYASKLEYSVSNNLSEPDLETKFLVYLKTVCPDGEINGLDSVVMKLRCSRRQLQRVLKKLCEEGTIEKTGRGNYRLI